MAVAAVALHRYFQHSPAYSKTPLELEAAPLSGCNSSVWLFSGSGRNIDIRRALKTLVLNERNQLTVFCGKIGSPLESDARKAFIDRVFSFDTALERMVTWQQTRCSRRYFSWFLPFVRCRALYRLSSNRQQTTNSVTSCCKHKLLRQLKGSPMSFFYTGLVESRSTRP